MKANALRLFYKQRKCALHGLAKIARCPPVFPSLYTCNINCFVHANINNFDFRITLPVFNISLGDIWSYYPSSSTRNLLALQ